jgi:hypothetical protein
MQGPLEAFTYAMPRQAVVRGSPNVTVGETPMVRHLRVLNSYGGITADFDVQCM